MPVAIGREPVSVLSAIVPDGMSILVESLVFELGVTIVWPSKLIQCAWFDQRNGSAISIF
jgi:hypothetical protein